MISEKKATINEHEMLLINKEKVYCPLGNMEFGQTSCGRWCPAFMEYEIERYLQHEGGSVPYKAKQKRVKLCCFPQEVVYELEETP